ncbi:hypothetical protein BD324DRAFT_647511 [Kockovaella imperatae]|uniref:Uncharacterized protein n=1 Tax=Kockovaella imperatae TaxID=4999 RepID=A0A1Y1USH3_9TREE|nr:hypothetical protein BD324DRAFT_647511 [Kockovaella imperatae]ORX40587.1 hypothetical protein BD324DRAFT_647511 [Kockovaella imperatae]
MSTCDVTIATLRTELDGELEVDYGDAKRRDKLRLELLEFVEGMDEGDVASKTSLGSDMWAKLTEYRQMSIPKTLTDELKNMRQERRGSVNFKSDTGSNEADSSIRSDWDRLSGEQQQSIKDLVDEYKIKWRTKTDQEASRVETHSSGNQFE